MEARVRKKSGRNAGYDDARRVPIPRRERLEQVEACRPAGRCVVMEAERMKRVEHMARVGIRISEKHRIYRNDIFFIYKTFAQDIDIAPSMRLTGFQTGEAINASTV
ncbi:hypothetical protein QZM81_22895 [Burkholderia cepacia]|uniref:hypothetical protein n=1 Tax=Burkholderia cepacia TaxID=292 RepID=UPI00264CAEED|nr:hypothetical protein [Burkholderia cepacia]MDN7858653.1 hypothetical protein [Burkholderia cepacia]